LCNRTPERVGLHVVREAPPTVDLDHGQLLPVRRLESGIAGDVDLAQLEVELLPQPAHLLERALAEMTAVRVEDGNFDHEYSVRRSTSSARKAAG